MRIGFIGVGVMGSRMVRRLMEAGHEVVVYHRSPEKIVHLLDLGMEMAASISQLSSSCDIIFTCLSMPEDVIEVYLGSNGILANAGTKTICIDFTSVDPKTSQQVSEKAKRFEIDYLDAPVSGGPEGAESGSLTIMVGGQKDTFEKVEKYLSILGKTIIHLGPSGSGSTAKLINQYLVAVHSVAASEAMVIGTANGLNPEQLYEILNVSYGNSRILQRHMENFVFDRNFKPGGAVKYVHKDVRLANQLFLEAGIERYLGELAEKSFANAISLGLGELDMSAVIQPLEKHCQIQVKKDS